VSVSGDRVLVNDTVALDANLFANDGCFNVRATEVSCALSTVSRAELHLGSRSDEILPLTSLPIRVEGGGGNDRLLGGLTAGVSQVDFRGGAGIDRADYGLATSGVTVTKDEAANDGRTNLDRDVIRGDVERLEGSAFGDSLNGSSSTTITETLVGRGGNDVLSGNGGTNVYAMGAQADGADTVNGGSGTDRADYQERTRPVTATASIGDGNDGEAGEGDSLRSVESVIGGLAGDTLSAPFGSRVSYQLAGGRGIDTITGAEGPDVLSGGPDRDTITGAGGDDRISARDRLSDLLSCGLGTDTAIVDAVDSVASCETRDVG
jgi:Ca2+-binding RTX toxin-like protein